MHAIPKLIMSLGTLTFLAVGIGVSSYQSHLNAFAEASTGGPRQQPCISTICFPA